MKDFTIPFDPTTACPPCSGNCDTCSNDSIDSTQVTIQVPVGFAPLANDAPGKPIMENGECVGEDRSGEEVFESLTLTVGQLKELFVSRLTSGDYVDTRRELFSIRAALQSPPT